MRIFDRVKFDGLKSRDWLVYKHPNEKLVLGTQLIVNEGQAAIFVKGGQIYDVFYSGTHTLSTDNLPVLSSVLNLFYGNKSPFTAEIYFINLATKLDMYWGTPNPIQLIDPKYFVKLRIRAYGQFAIRLDDPLLFFKEIIVSLKKDELMEYEKVQEYFRGTLITYIKTALANKIIKEKISALDITAEIPVISNDLKDRVTKEFSLYGFTLINFHIQSINFPDEDFDQINSILQDKARFEIMGEDLYERKRSFDNYEKATSNQFILPSLDTQFENEQIHAHFRFCPSCNERILKNSRFCNFCGAKLEIQLICHSCGSENEENSNFCTTCGTKLVKLDCACGNKLNANDQYCNYCGKKVEQTNT